VAKSAWKFLRTNKKEIYLYKDEFKLLTKKQGHQVIGYVKSNHIINNINFTFNCAVHLGKYIVFKKFYYNSIRSKIGEFLKFTKPFHFRSKKKK
jgi:ABC-type cobalamin/Fe3+-siderophores transport system ATPase subunit